MAVVNHAICISLISLIISIQCENQRMLNRSMLPFYWPASLAFVAALLFCFAAPISAQEGNVLGLPAVPQPKPGSPAAAASPAGKAAGAIPAAQANRAAIQGEMGLQHSALNGLGRLIITTRATFVTAGAQSDAIDAARSVQRDLAKVCGKQCKPEKMASPKILSSGQLEFELTFRPLYQHLSQPQFLAALQSQPFNLTPAQLTPPATESTTPPASTASK